MAFIIRVTTEFGKNSTLSQIHFLTKQSLESVIRLQMSGEAQI